MDFLKWLECWCFVKIFMRSDWSLLNNEQSFRHVDCNLGPYSSHFSLLFCCEVAQNVMNPYSMRYQEVEACCSFKFRSCGWGKGAQMELSYGLVISRHCHGCFTNLGYLAQISSKIWEAKRELLHISYPPPLIYPWPEIIRIWLSYCLAWSSGMQACEMQMTVCTLCWIML